MRLKDINLQVLEEVVSYLGPRFYTKDVSEHPEMIREHQEFVDNRFDNYHSAVGRVISKYCRFLNVVEIERKTPRGSRWEKIISD
jgi:hypothetical protein